MSDPNDPENPYIIKDEFDLEYHLTKFDILSLQQERRVLNTEVLAYINQYEKDWEKKAEVQRKTMRDVVDNIQVECLAILVNSKLDPLVEQIDTVLEKNQKLLDSNKELYKKAVKEMEDY